MLNILMLDKNR